MKAAVARFKKPVEAWLTQKAATRKPLLVHGPLFSGKKTLLRLIFAELDFDVIEPSPRDGLKELREHGLRGLNAYLMDVQVFGAKKLPKNVGNAPQIFVTHAPYDIASKAELTRRFHVLEMLTNFDATRKSGHTHERDHVPTYWQAVDVIRRDDIERALQACELAGEFLPEIVHRSYMSKASLTLEQLARTADMLALADFVRRTVRADTLRFLDTIGPVRECKLTSRDLQLKPPMATTLLKRNSTTDSADQRQPPAYAKRQKTKDNDE